LKIDSIKVFGERHSGTNAIGHFAGKNFNLKFQHYDFLGWKHRLASKKDITASLAVPYLDKKAIQRINSFLSLETMKKCNYRLLT